MLAAMHPSMLSALLLRALLYCCLVRAGAQISIEQVGSMMTPQRVGPLRELLSAAYRISMPEPKTKIERGSVAKSLTWPELWAEAHVYFRLTDEEWKEATPKQFAALREAEVQRNLPMETMLANLTAHVVFYSARGPQKFPHYERFMLHPPEKTKSAEDDRPMTGDEMAAAFSAIVRGIPQS